MPPPIKADDLFASWARRQWKSSYLFTGQEDFLIDLAVQQALQYWLGTPPEPLNFDRLDAEVQSIEEIIQTAQTVPFFGSQRVIRVQNTASLSSADQKTLLEAFQTLSPDTHMLWVWGKEWRRDDAAKPLVGAMLEKGQVVIFWPLFPEAAQRWILQRAKQYEKSLAPDAAQWLVQQVGESLRLLDQELVKCSAYVGNRPAIELEDVQTSFGYQKACSPFDWISAIRQKKSTAALPVLNLLLKEGEEPIRLLALATRNIRDWHGAKHSGENAATLAMRFHVRRGEEHRFAQELGRWTEEELTEGLGRCLEAEQLVKTGKETPEMALTLLTLRLCRAEAVHAIR